jgi:hypothetical protein
MTVEPAWPPVMDDFLVKPMSPDSLRAMLIRWAGPSAIRVMRAFEPEKAHAAQKHRA